MDEQEFEHIPWSSLVVEETGRRRQRLVYLAIGAAAAAIVGFIGVRWLIGPDHGRDLVTEPSAPPAAEETIVSTTTTLPALSEADLRAPPEPADASLAMMRAEWFVTDFFTVDGDPAQLAAIEDALADGVQRPDLPHEVGETPVITYVEWARAFRAEPIANATFAVDVAYRTIADTGDGRFERTAVRAVQVLVMVGDGSSAVADIPTPIPPPGDAGWFVVETLEGAATPEMSEDAMDYARLFDEDAELVSIVADGTSWRAVVLVDAGTGVRFPMTVSTALLP